MADYRLLLATIQNKCCWALKHNCAHLYSAKPFDLNLWAHQEGVCILDYSYLPCHGHDHRSLLIKFLHNEIAKLETIPKMRENYGSHCQMFVCSSHSVISFNVCRIRWVQFPYLHHWYPMTLPQTWVYSLPLVWKVTESHPGEPLGRRKHSLLLGQFWVRSVISRDAARVQPGPPQGVTISKVDMTTSSEI